MRISVSKHLIFFALSYNSTFMFVIISTNNAFSKQLIVTLYLQRERVADIS